MAHHSKVWAVAPADHVSTVDSAKLVALDNGQFTAIDGDAGGSWSPTSAIEVGGEGIHNAELADTTALKAVDTTSLSDGAYRYVLGLGRFKLDKSGAGASDTEDLPLCVAPTTGTGRWFAEDARAAKQYVKTITASTTYTPPRNLALALVEVVGGGGGGAGGSSSSASSDDAPGGAGGGAGQRVLAVVAMPSPPSAQTAHVGAGGAGGPGGILPTFGSDGGQTYLGSLATANGGQGGAGYGPSAGAVLITGGRLGGAGALPDVIQVTSLTVWPINLGDGAYARNGVKSGQDGGFGALGAAGGSGGAAGTTSTNKGGSGGAGGGSGAYGVGGTGGAGGNGTSGASGAPQAGGAATSALANTGAGGGGGGGAGAAGSGSASGGAGGSGGSGLIVIRGFALTTAAA